MLLKLKDIKKEDYENLSQELSEKFKRLSPKKLNLKLDNFFDNCNDEMDFYCFVEVIPIVDKEFNYYELSFDFNFEDKYKKFCNLVKTRELNKKTIKKLKKFYYNIDYKECSSLEEVFEIFDNEKNLFEFMTNFFVDFRYGHKENYLHTHYFYTGLFRRQGLMNYLFDSLGKIIDLDDLKYIEVDDIVEKSTCYMFNKLRKKIPNDDYLANLLKRKYVKSPFMRTFCNMGYKKMNVITNDKYISTIRVNRSDELIFSIFEEID